MAKIIPFPFNEKTGRFDIRTAIKHSQNVDTKYALSEDEVTFVNNLLREIATLYKTPIEKIIKSGRTHHQARKLFAHFCEKKTSLTEKIIGGFLNGRDHTSVIYFLKNHAVMLNSKRKKHAVYKKYYKILNKKLALVYVKRKKTESVTKLHTDEEVFRMMYKFAREVGCEKPYTTVKNFLIVEQ